MRTFSPGKSGVPPVMSSASMHPTDHMSTGVEYTFVPSRISGARYHSVTTCAKAKDGMIEVSWLAGARSSAWGLKGADAARACGMCRLLDPGVL
jgi:hypothetical protein